MSAVMRYRLSDAAIRRLLLRQDGTWIAMASSLALGIGIGLLGRAPLWPLVLVYTVFVLLYGKSFGRGAGLKNRWRNFEVVLEPDRLLVREPDSVESTVNRSEIAKMFEIPGDALRIYAPGKYISIPTLLTGYEELKATLANWSPMGRQRPMQLWRYVGMPAPLAVYVSTLLVRTPYVFFPLFVFCGFYLFRIARIFIKHWKQSNERAEMAIPFVMLALLLLKLASIVF